MPPNLLAVATTLLLYQGIYYLYLLYIGLGWGFDFFPYELFRGRLLTSYSLEARLLFLLLLVSVNYTQISHWLGASYKQELKGVLKLCGWSLVLGLFVLVEELFSLKFVLWAYPSLLGVLLIGLPLHTALPARGKLQLTNPSYDQNTPLSILLPTQKGHLPINNPQRGIYVLGNQGSGKTRFVMEPLLYALLKKGYAGLIYDYDFEGTPAAPDDSYGLTKFAYNCFLRFGPGGRRFEVINFSDLQRSARINPIAPAYIQNRAYLEEYVSVLLHNLNPASNRNKDFWLSSTQALLKSIIVLLANNFPTYCTLPHALAFALLPIEKVLETIRLDSEAYAYASSIFDAFDGKEKAAGQLAGIIATFKVSLQLLVNKHLFWVLSRDDISLAINDKAQPTILCIGNYPPAKAAYSPIIALLLTVCFKAMYGHNRVKSFVAIDELPTLFIPALSELPATGRKYGIATIACLQSNAQLEHTYGRVGAKQIQQTLVNKFLGSAEDDSATYASQLLGKTEQVIATASTSYSTQAGRVSESHGSSEQRQLKEVLTAQQIMSLEVGEFVGKVAESNKSFFQSKLKPVSSYDRALAPSRLQDLPISQQPVTLEANYQRIQGQAARLPEEMRRLQVEKASKTIF